MGCLDVAREASILTGRKLSLQAREPGPRGEKPAIFREGVNLAVDRGARTELRMWGH